MTAPPVVRVTAMTHRGLVRTANEDSLAIGAFVVSGTDMREPAVVELALSEPAVVAVADGMGGHAAGATASAHVVAELTRATSSRSAPVDADALTALLHDLDGQLLGRGGTDPQLTGMGTTVAGVLLGPGPALAFTVGDSRIYQERAGFLTLLSTDDRAAGGALTQCLGGAGGTLTPSVAALPGAFEGGRLLLCTDGLSDLVGVEEMESLLARPDGSTRAVKALWVAAMNASGRDNTSIVLVEAPSGVAG